MTQQIEKTIKALEKNNMKAYCVKNKQDVLPLLESLIDKDSLIAVGGSETLKETGVIQKLQSGEYNFLDRYENGLNGQQIMNVLHKTALADVFLSSSNAVTQNGELYNVDGTSNRIAAICFGPKKVILVVGANKIVKDLKEAEIRVKTVAAPKNAQRLHHKTPCFESGECVSLKFPEHSMCDGCRISERICSNYLVCGYQQEPGRITVIICEESLGY